MTERYLSANRLLACNLRTSDGGRAVLRDLVIDTEAWSVGFLAVEIEGWAPDREVLLLPSDLAAVDTVRGEVALGLDAPTLRAGPSLTAGTRLGGMDADRTPPAGWQSQWAADADAAGRGENPPLAPGPVQSRVPDMGDGGDLIRAETLRGYTVETADGVRLRLLDLLIDDADWSVAYLELAIATDRGGRALDEAIRCIVPRRAIDWLNRSAQLLHVAVWGDELREGELVPHPATPERGPAVRVASGDG
jgi:hypothetical protein